MNILRILLNTFCFYSIFAAEKLSSKPAINKEERVGYGSSPSDASTQQPTPLPPFGGYYPSNLNYYIPPPSSVQTYGVSAVNYPAPVYIPPTYPSPSYPPSTYPSPSYPAPTYPSPNYPVSTYSSSGYPAPTYPSPSYSGSSYPSPGYSGPSNPSPSYPVPTYPSPSYPVPTYPSPSYPVPTYPSPSYPGPTYSSPVYPAPANPSYSASTYPVPSYPSSSNSVPSYSFPLPPQPTSYPSSSSLYNPSSSNPSISSYLVPSTVNYPISPPYPSYPYPSPSNPYSIQSNPSYPTLPSNTYYPSSSSNTYTYPASPTSSYTNPSGPSTGYPLPPANPSYPYSSYQSTSPTAAIYGVPSIYNLPQSGTYNSAYSTLPAGFPAVSSQSSYYNNNGQYGFYNGLPNTGPVNPYMFSQIPATNPQPPIVAPAPPVNNTVSKWFPYLLAIPRPFPLPFPFPLKTESSTTSEIYPVVICEGGSNQFECPNGKKIELTQVFYGRKSTQICNPVPTAVGFDSEAKYKNTGCTLSSAFSTLQTKCNNQPSCLVSATPKEFGQDPCSDTIKYAEISHICK